MKVQKEREKEIESFFEDATMFLNLRKEMDIQIHKAQKTDLDELKESHTSYIIIKL